MILDNPVKLDHCPLCLGTESIEDSVPEPNLYSEKLAYLLDKDETSLCNEYANWRCLFCGIFYKRRWFHQSIIRELFRESVATHPKGWDSVNSRFTRSNFQNVVAQWVQALELNDIPRIRLGQRELLSIVDSIIQPVGYDPKVVAHAIRKSKVSIILNAVPSILASMGEPAPFKRYSGFQSGELWEYIQERTGGFDTYAELGCPLWGLLSIAADRGCRAAYLVRDEPNYWGKECKQEGEYCVNRLLSNSGIVTAEWLDPSRYGVIGLFQYLDHLLELRPFLQRLFSKTNSAAVIIDSGGSPLAIQHVTGWSAASFSYVARLFGKQLHDDFDAIRPSGNRLYLLTPH
jgi:hypothetical protein